MQSYAAPVCEGAEQPRIGQHNNPGEGVVALYDGASESAAVTPGKDFQIL